MKLAYPMETAPGFSVDFGALLEPVEEGEGAGVSLRYEPIYQQVRDARKHDDASLPMREWERPLVKADWRRVAALCSEALATRSKDFQLAAWLCEAWTHLHQIEGLVAGTRLMTALADRYWQSAWPELEAGDADARVAPFVWLNDALALVLTLHVPLVAIEGREPASVNLDEWQRVITSSGDQAGADLTRDLLEKHVKQGSNLAALVSLHLQLEAAVAAWSTFNALLDELLGHEAPHLGRVADTLALLARAATSLIGNHALRPAPRAHVEEAAAHDVIETAQAVDPENTMTVAVSEQASAPRAAISRVESRTHAYQLLDLVARYLAEHEPHSPTPFLLQRAVTWGQMPLPELMREIVRTEGDMARYLAMLGIE
jgi:type VI secretion system protein ImpA